MSASFSELGLARDLVAHLTELGITEPSPIQAATLPDLLAGRDVCAGAPTGSGKTIAFAAPLMDRLPKGGPNRPAALVLTPTRELAAQIHDVMIGMGRIRRRFSATVYGGVRQGPQVNNLRRGVDVLVACPGRLEDLIDQGHVQLDKVSILVIDEADRMADMGFLPCVERIAEQCAPERQTMLFSATLDGAADKLARNHLKNPVKHSVAPKEEDLGKATHLFWTASPDQRPQLSADIVRKAGRTVLFTRTKHGADRLTAKLQSLGVQAAVIHGGCSQAARDRSLEDFHRGRVDALVATDVAARGIHVDKVACVVHHDLPDSPTDYQHRSGRTARAGATGTVVSLVTPEQRRHARNVQRHFGFPNGHTQPNIDLVETIEAPPMVPETVRPERTGRPPFKRDDRPGFTRDDRPGYARRDDRPAYGERRPYDGPRNDRPGYQRDDRPAYGRPPFKRDDRPAYNRDDRPSYQRDDRPSYGRPPFKRDDRPGFKRDDRPAYNRDDRPAYNRDDRPTFKRDDRPAYNRDDRPTFKRDDRPAYNRDDRPTFKRDDRPAYNRDDRPTFKRDDRPAYNRDDRPAYNRDDRPGYKRDERPAYGGDRPRNTSESGTRWTGGPARYGDARPGAGKGGPAPRGGKPGKAGFNGARSTGGRPAGKATRFGR